ncbi:MAG: class I SAM-dependent methyltransferase [bacterium]|nr:class I SAM-dependent methyltransferase [bacterium]
MRTNNLTYQKDEWQNIWTRRGWLTAIVNIDRKTYNWFWRRHLRKFISKDTRLVEVGCGTATLTLSLAGEIKELVGVDITESAIELSRKHAKDLGVTNSRFELGDCLNLPYQDEFDVVWSQGLMEHFEHPEVVAAEHYKATKPGGTTLISVPYKYSYHTLWYVLTRPKFLRFLWPWTDILYMDKKRLTAIGKALTPKARVYFLQPFLLGIVILELP